MSYNFKSREQFEARVIETSLNHMFNGRLFDAASQVVDFAMSFGSDDSDRFDKDKLLPKLASYGENFSFTRSDGNLEVILLASGFPTFEQHQAMVRMEMAKAILEGRLFAKAVVDAAYRIAVITCSQKTVAHLGATLFN